MSDFDRNLATARSGYRTDQVAIDAGLRAYMIRVYNYMAAGVALTGLVCLADLSGGRRRRHQVAGGRSAGSRRSARRIFSGPLTMGPVPGARSASSSS